jgi:iron complex transport system substrate-binding protein
VALWLGVVAGALAQGGCCGGEQRCTAVAGMLGPVVPQRTQVVPESPARPWAFPKWLVDPLGRRQPLARPPRRIVSTILLADEILYDLVPPQRLAGVSNLVDEPTETVLAGRVPRSIQRVTGELEPVLALAPDLVIVASYTPAELVLPLAAAGIPVLRFDHFHSLADVEAAVTATGAAVGSEAIAATLVNDLRTRMAAVERRARGHRAVRTLLWQVGGYTYGDGTLADELLLRAGGHNVARDLGLKGNVPVGVEQVLATQPELVVLSVGEQRVALDATGFLPKTAAWRGVAAVRHRRVVGLPSAWLGSVSPVSVRAAEALADVVARLAAETAPPPHGDH